MSKQDLVNLPIAELRQRAQALGLKPHPRSKPETLADNILATIAQRMEDERLAQVQAKKPAPAPQPVQDTGIVAIDASHPAAAPQDAVHFNTPADINARMADLIDRGLRIEYDAADNTWTFYNDTRKTCESGNMSIPLRVIRMKAESVMRGGRMPPIDRDQNGKFMWA